MFATILVLAIVICCASLRDLTTEGIVMPATLATRETDVNKLNNLVSFKPLDSVLAEGPQFCSAICVYNEHCGAFTIFDDDVAVENSGTKKYNCILYEMSEPIEESSAPKDGLPNEGSTFILPRRIMEARSTIDTVPDATETTETKDPATNTKVVTGKQIEETTEVGTTEKLVEEPREMGTTTEKQVEESTEMGTTTEKQVDETTEIVTEADMPLETLQHDSPTRHKLKPTYMYPSLTKPAIDPQIPAYPTHKKLLHLK